MNTKCYFLFNNILLIQVLKGAELIAVSYSKKMDLSHAFHYASQLQHSSLEFIGPNLINTDATTCKAIKFKYKI